MTFLSGTLLASAAMVVLPAMPAHAGLVGLQDSEIYYEGQGTQSNRVTITHSGSTYVITDVGGGVSPQIYPGREGCTIVDADTATCPSEGITAIRVYGGAGVDHVTIQDDVPVPSWVGGGPGDDTLLVLSEGQDDFIEGHGDDDVLGGGSGDDVLTGTDGNDEIDGGPGNDHLFGDIGTDALTGGDGDDVLDPSAGLTDVVSGGPGRDRVDYLRDVPVSVSLDGVANDGELGELDNVDDTVEIVHGGTRDDNLTGSDGKQVLDGGLGHDTLSGEGGNDRLIGGTGNDDLDGGTGDDLLDGGEGADSFAGGADLDSVSYAASDFDVSVTLDDVANDGFAGESDNVHSDMEDITTGSGDDVLVGTTAANEFTTGAGSDTVTAGGGSDGVEAGPGRDTVNGGKGIDSLYGQGGPDTINSRDKSKDYVACGGSVDKVTRNKGDQLTVDCEKVS